MRKDIVVIAILLVLLLFSLVGNVVSFDYLRSMAFRAPALQDEEDPKPKTRSIMMLIEYKDTEGLVNFVNDLHSRGIYSLLSASPDFVEENCAVIKKLLNYGMELVSQNPSGSFWDMSYEEQYAAIKDAKEKIEACTEKPLKVVSSRYFASDENTAKAAEELGIPYVLARGTTGTEAIVFKPEEYNVKIISVSNIPSIYWKYGSLCDYSYWVREGRPQDMMDELTAALDNKKVTPVTHTNIGGLKAQWNDMWLEFFDNADIEWQSLNDFASADMVLPMWRIPRNANAPYTPEKRPLIPYDEEENVDNPCAVDDLPEVPGETNNDSNNKEKILMFHNGQGPMCLEALEFIETIDYPVEQFLDHEQGFYEKLNGLKQEFSQSQGVSDSFGYYPIIFIKDKAFSGFNQDIEAQILGLIEGK